MIDDLGVPLLTLSALGSQNCITGYHRVCQLRVWCARLRGSGVYSFYFGFS